MYYALRIALESDGWNESYLINMTVSVFLYYCEITHTPISNGIQWLYEVTQPVEDYSPVEVNNTSGNSTTIYRYLWTINVDQNYPPYHTVDLLLVDAATGEIVPHPPLLG
jgi:hypothetical protein